MKTRKEIENEILGALKNGTMDIEGIVAVVSYFQVLFVRTHKQLRQAKKELEQVKEELERVEKDRSIIIQRFDAFKREKSYKPREPELLVLEHVCPRCGRLYRGDFHVCFTIDTQSQTNPITVTSTTYPGKLPGPPKPEMLEGDK